MKVTMKKRLVKAYEITLPILALLDLFAIISIGLNYFSPREQGMAMFIFCHATWIIFVLDYFVRLTLTDSKKHFVTSHIAEFISIVPITPFLILEEVVSAMGMADAAANILNATFIIKFLAYLTRTFVMQRRFIKTNQLHYTAAISLTSLVVAAMLFAGFEDRSYEDGLWWAFVTASTTGFGDVVPVTQGGRLVGMFLMVVGLSCISMLTGVIASRLMQSGTLKNIDNENIAFIQQRLNNFTALSEDQVEELCAMLKAIKKCQKPLHHSLPQTASPIHIDGKNRFAAWLLKTFTSTPEDDGLLEKKIVK